MSVLRWPEVDLRPAPSGGAEGAPCSRIKAVSAADFIRSFGYPVLEITCDAYPGILNPVPIHVYREGIF
jgi:hypothetical protein